MGMSISWIGIRGLAQEQIMDVLGLTQAPSDAKRPKASLWSMPNGWTVVLTADFSYPTPERMAALSAEGTAIALSADDRVMVSCIRGYAHGKAVFAIEHDGGNHGSHHMAVAGTPPARWAELRERLAKVQDREDAGESVVDYMFEAPAMLARMICGYRQDRPWREGQAPETIALIDRKGAGLLRRLFGGR